MLTTSTDQYVASVVEKYRIVPDADSESHHAANEVIPLVKQWGKQFMAGMTLSGAYAKNTAISLASDVDVLVALNPVPGKDMKSIFWSLFEFLSDRDLRPHTRDVSMRVEADGCKVDLIPARRERGASTVLYNKRLREEVRTDVGRHVHLVANSGRQQEICALKIWRERMKLEFPSFCLELTVLNALEGERFGQLTENVRAALRHIANRFERVNARDPANEENIVSNDLTVGEKAAIAKAARDALYDENWKKILW